MSSNQTKQMITQWSSLGAADPYLFYNGGIWNSNSTVTSIQLSTFYGYNFSTASTFTLYGIA